MNLLLAAVAALTLALAGAGALRVVWPQVGDEPRYVRWALGYCVGSGMVAVIFFVAYLAGIPFSRPVLLVPVVTFAVVGVTSSVCCRASAPLAREGRAKTAGGAPALQFFLAAGGLLMLLAFALSWLRPIYGYDAVSMWALKAKVAFFARTWPVTLFDPHTTHHPEYPPLVPVAQTFVLFFLGKFDDVASRVVFAAFYASGAGILWWLLGRLRVSARGMWWLWWCAVPLMMEQVEISYADLPLAVFVLVFFGGITLWLREPHRREWLALAAIFGGLAFWVKEDALIGVGGGCAALVIVALKRKLPLEPAGKMILLTALIAAPWPILAWWKELPGGFGFPASDLGGRLVVILRELFNAAFVEGGYAFFWPVFVLTLVFCRRRLAKTENLWLTLATGLGLLGIVIVYAATKLDLVPHLKTSVDRVLVSLFVPALLLVALLWQASFHMLRCRRWQAAAAGALLVAAIAMFWSGLHRKSDEELLGVSISPFPLALSWVWLATGVITMLKFATSVRRLRPALVWRATQFALVVATCGLAAVSVGVRAREAGELWRRFAGKTLAERHAATIDPRVREQLDVTLREWPVGTHVRVRPKRSILYHQFYYEAFPSLIVDDSAAREVNFGSAP